LLSRILSTFTAPMLLGGHRPRCGHLAAAISGLSPASVDEQVRLIDGFRQRVMECNLPGPPSLPFLVNDVEAGEVAADLLPLLRSHPDVLEVGVDAVRLAEPVAGASVEKRTAAMATVTQSMRDAGLVEGWRDELLALATAFDAPPAFLIERACLPLFGGKGYGIFVNGYSIEPSTGVPWLWVATRSASKPTWPGMLDVIVGGALSAGMSPSASVIKEAAEEAGVPLALAEQARPASCCSYRGTDERGYLKRDVLFCYDLELPWEFEPLAIDGEVDRFERMPLSRVAEAVAYGTPAAYKPNCNLVVADFLVRYGYVSGDVPGYLPLLADLRAGDCR